MGMVSSMRVSEDEIGNLDVFQILQVAYQADSLQFDEASEL